MTSSAASFYKSSLVITLDLAMIVLGKRLRAETLAGIVLIAAETVALIW